MAYVDAPGTIARVTVAWQMPDTHIQENNVCYVCTAGGGGDTRFALGTAVNAAFTGSYLAVMSSLTSNYGFKVSILNVKPPPRASTSAFTQAGLVGSTPPLATQTRPVLTWLTASGGRGFRGRLYFPTPASTLITSAAVPDPTVVAAMGTVATALAAISAVGGSTWALALAHRVAGPPVTWTSTLITNATPRALYGTQRKSGNYGRVNASPW